jgi:hypothetical protein
MELIGKMFPYELGPEAFRYVCSQIEQGGPLTSALKLSPAGSVWAFIPSGAASSQRAEDFGGGAVFTAEDAYEILRHVIGFIAEFLDRNSLTVVIAEDQFFKLSDPPNLGHRLVFEYGGKTYHYRQSAEQDSNLRAAEQIVNEVSHYPLILILTRIPSNASLPNRGAIDKYVANALVSGIEHVIVGAYDEEGYIIWSRKPDCFSHSQQ